MYGGISKFWIEKSGFFLVIVQKYSRLLCQSNDGQERLCAQIINWMFYQKSQREIIVERTEDHLSPKCLKTLQELQYCLLNCWYEIVSTDSFQSWILGMFLYQVQNDKMIQVKNLSEKNATWLSQPGPFVGQTYTVNYGSPCTGSETNPLTLIQDKIFQNYQKE